MSNNADSVGNRSILQRRIRILRTSKVERQDQTFFSKGSPSLCLVIEQSRMIYSNPNTVSKGECIKKINLLPPLWTYQVFLFPKYKFSIQPSSSKCQQYFCSSSARHFSSQLFCHEHLSPNLPAHLPPCLMKQVPHILPKFFPVSKQMHISTTRDILITCTFWRKVSTSAVS